MSYTIHKPGRWFFGVSTSTYGHCNALGGWLSKLSRRHIVFVRWS